MKFIEPFPYVIKYKKGRENIVADALSRMYALLTSLDAKLIGFKYVKKLYEHHSDFAQILLHVKRGYSRIFIELTITCSKKTNYVYHNLLCESCL